MEPVLDADMGAIFDTGDPAAGFITSDSLLREGGWAGGECDGERECVVRSVSRAGEGALDVGERVAIGGSATLPGCERPAPMGRGWGGRTDGNCGLDG